MAIWSRENGAVISGEPITETVVAATDLITPVGPRVRWSGVMSGFVVAIGTLMLLGALGLAVGITALGDPRAASGETAAGLGIGAGIWAVITLLVSIFLGGMVSTTAAAAAGIAKFLFFLFVVIFLIMLVLGLMGRRSV
jgi:uncharacterized membrane protein YtjA (UPF0391 family)